MRRGFVVAVLVAVAAAAWFATPALAEDTFVRWTPQGVLPGQWSESAPAPVDQFRSGNTECKGQQRVWANSAGSVRFRLTWLECDGDMDVVVADLDDRRGDRYANAGVPGALGDGLDVFEQAGGANQRTWVEGRYRITVLADCTGGAVAGCTGLTAAAARDISGRLPGEPIKTVGGRSTTAINWILGVALFGLAVIGVATGFRRFRRDSYDVAAGVRRWTPVDATARGTRRAARRRRIAMLLVAPLLVGVLVTLARSVSHTTDVQAVAMLVLFGVVLGVPAVVLLVVSRGAPRPDDWHRQLRRADLPRGRRIAASLLDAGSGLTLALLVLLFLVGVGAGRVVSLPPVLTAFFQMLFFGLLAIASPIGRWVRSRTTADAWTLLNARSGEPILYVRGFGGEQTELRAAPGGSRGPLHRAARLLKALRKQPFEDILTGLLVRQGRVVAVQPPGWPLRPIGPVTFALDAGRPALARAVEDAQMVVLMAGAEPRAHELARDVVELCAERPLVVVLPPGPPDEVGAGWLAWWRAVAEIPPVGDLHPSFVPDGTHVLVHVPGDGWFAWGAGYRDEYTYAAAVHDAVAHAAAGIQRARRAGDVPVAYASAAAHTVGVLAAPADEAAARDMVGQLTRMNVTAAETPAEGPPPATVVVVISAEAVADGAWRAAVGRLLSGPARPVPVVRGVVRAGDLPPELSGRNWLRWDAGPRPVEAAALFAAVNSDPDRYETHRDLLTRATAWLAENRPDALLLTGVQESEAAVVHLIAAEQDSLARPSPLLRDFVTASAIGARRRRRQRRGLLIGAAALAIVTALLLSAGWYVLYGPAQNSRLTALVGLTSELAADRPDWIGVLAGALILQGNERQAAAARATLRTTLDATWPYNKIGVAHDAPITDMALVGSDDVLTADGAGTVTRWSMADGSVRWRRPVAEPLDRLAATPDGRYAVATSPGAVHLITTDPWQQRAVPVGGEVTDVAVTGDGRTAMYATEDGRLGAFDTTTGRETRRPQRYAAVLDLRPGTVAGTAWALVRTSAREVAIVDAVSGRVTARTVSARPAGDEYGSVGADGNYLAFGAADGELAGGPAGRALAPAGVRLPRAVYDVDVLSGGRIVTASPAYGVLAVQAPTGLVTARLRVSQQGIYRIRVSADGRFLLCTSGLGVVIWRTDGLWPDASAPDVAAPGSAPRATSGDLVVEGGADGVVTVRDDRYPVVTGPVTAAAISADRSTAVVGSGLGEVAEIDLAAGTVVRRWTAPTGGAVRTVGWDSAGRLAIRTTSWWSVPSCAGCGSDGPLLDALRSRIRGCYVPDNLKGIAKDTQRRLGLRECRVSPKAK